MKRTKKFASLLLAVVMVFALCSTALADEPGVITDSSGLIPINKHITMTNNTKGTYFSPNITFSYDITPATNEELLYQPTVGGATILAGINGGLVGDNTVSDDTHVVGNTADTSKQTATLQFKSRSVDNVDAKGADIVEQLVLKVVPSAFPHAGVYRYKVNDSTSFDTIKAAGLERPASYSAVFFVDVYIQNKDDGSGDLEPAGSVVSTLDPDPSANNKVPDKDSNGNYIQATPTSNGAGNGPATPYDDGQTFSPNDGYRVDEDGKLYKLIDGKTADDEPENPDYTDTTLYQPWMDTDPAEQIVVKTTSGSRLIKDGDGINEEPTSDWVDKNGGDGDSDKDNNDKPSKGDDGVEPVYDDEGNPVATTTTTDPETGDPVTVTKSYPEPEYKVDPSTGEILVLDPTATAPYDLNNDDDTDYVSQSPAVYQDYRETYTYKGDVYNTKNITLKKIVEGTMGDKVHEFKFTATVDNNGIQFKYQDAEATTATNGTSGTAFDALLNHEEVLNIRGLNPKATVTYTETNNTNETYKVKAVDGNSASIFTEAEVAKDGTAVVYETAAVITNYDASYALGVTPTVAASKNVTYTNTLDTVSPTGIALRYAPYIFMLAAAAVFVVLSRKERGTENA